MQSARRLLDRSNVFLFRHLLVLVCTRLSICTRNDEKNNFQEEQQEMKRALLAIKWCERKGDCKDMAKHSATPRYGRQGQSDQVECDTSRARAF